MWQEVSNWKFQKRYISLLAILLSIGGIFATNYWKSYRKKFYLSKLRKDKQKAKLKHKGTINKSSYQSGHPFSETVKEVWKLNLEELIEYLRQDENNYKLVFQDYQQQALFIDHKLNCVVEFLKLDVSDVDLQGPFAGIPISLKDNLSLKGYESYIGCSVFLGKPKANESCVLVQVLQKLGAIPFVKTTVPQTMMSILSSNSIDGSFKNPQNIKFITGGSSSGEGALVGGRGSILGFGSDIGGSVRIPAAFCGIVGFKPTSGRISVEGVFKIGIHSLVKSTVGPLSRDVASCVYTMRSIFNSDIMSKLDPQVPYLPFNETRYNKKKLKIGYFVYDQSFNVMPAMKRSVLECVKKLKARGHEVIEWKPPSTGREWYKLFLRSLSIDGGKKLKSLIENDKIDNAMSNGLIYINTNMFSHVYNFFKYKLPNWIIDQDLKLNYTCSTESLKGFECMALLIEIETLRVSFINEWSKYGLDGVICPAGGFTALPINFSGSHWPLLSYIFIWNLVNFPAGTVPVSKVDAKDIEEMKCDPIFKSTPTLRNISMMQQDTEGLSVSVQCVSLPWNEELCLNLMKEVEAVSKN